MAGIRPSSCLMINSTLFLIKNWTVGRPGYEATSLYLLTLQFLETIGVLSQDPVPTRNPKHIMSQTPVLVCTRSYHILAFLPSHWSRQLMSQVIYSEGEGATNILISREVTTLVTRPRVTFTSRWLYKVGWSHSQAVWPGNEAWAYKGLSFCTMSAELSSSSMNCSCCTLPWLTRSRETAPVMSADN